MKHIYSKDYLNYEVGYFPMKKIENDKKIDDEESGNEIDWEYSSQGDSEDDEYFKNKKDIKNKRDEEFEDYSDTEDIKPIVKY